MFTQKCFIRKNTPELVKKLEELGYKALFSASNVYGEYLFCQYDTVFSYDLSEKSWHPNNLEWIDCGTNENLLLAIASIRYDTDNMQWFVDPCGHWHFNPTSLDGLRKATVQELIEHFNK